MSKWWWKDGELINTRHSIINHCFTYLIKIHKGKLNRGISHISCLLHRWCFDCNFPITTQNKKLQLLKSVISARPQMFNKEAWNSNHSLYAVVNQCHGGWFVEVISCLQNAKPTATNSVLKNIWRRQIGCMLPPITSSSAPINFAFIHDVSTTSCISCNVYSGQ